MDYKETLRLKETPLGIYYPDTRYYEWKITTKKLKCTNEQLSYCSKRINIVRLVRNIGAKERHRSSYTSHNDIYCLLNKNIIDRIYSMFLPVNLVHLNFRSLYFEETFNDTLNLLHITYTSEYHDPRETMLNRMGLYTINYFPKYDIIECHMSDSICGYYHIINYKDNGKYKILFINSERRFQYLYRLMRKNTHPDILLKSINNAAKKEKDFQDLKNLPSPYKGVPCSSNEEPTWNLEPDMEYNI